MEKRVENARPRVIRGTRAKPLPLLPSGPGGVYGRPLHEARSLTTSNANMRALRFTSPWIPRGLGVRQWGLSGDTISGRQVELPDPDRRIELAALVLERNATKTKPLK